jgi:Uma2 family endonuclease
MYERLLIERDKIRKDIRLTYDHGRLEIMTVSRTHERWKSVLARLLEMFAFALRIPLVSSGNLTIRRQDLARGLEPDVCYYVQNANAMSEVRELDLSRDPPFDLVLEVEYSQTVETRLPILDSLGVNEVWRFDGNKLRVLLRQPQGGYRETTKSAAFPQLPIAEFEGFLRRTGTMNDTELAWQFFEWVQRTLVPPAANP